jgi:hypothetical protein
MKIWRLALLLCLVAVLADPGLAQVQLEFKPQQKFSVELKSEYRRIFRSPKGEIKDRTESTQVLDFATLKANADGTRVIEVTIASFKEVGTDDAGKKKENAHPELEGAVFQVALDADLNITKIDGLDEALKKFDPKVLAKASSKAYQLSYLENVLRFWVGQVIVPLPAKAVNKGDRWEQKTIRTMSAYGNLKLTKTLTYQGAEGDLQKLGFTTAHAFSQLKQTDVFPFKVVRVSINKADYAGTIYFDPAAGRIARSESKELRDLVMTLSYDALDRDVRVRDEGTSSVRYLDKNP